MKWNKLYHYPPCVRSTTDGIRTYNVGNEDLPSVTPILSATQTEEKKRKLAEWRAIKGKAEADRIKQQAASRGSNMHLHLEKYILGEGHLDLTEEGKTAQSMAQTVIDQGLGDLQEIWGSEVTLWYPGLYAGLRTL